jgi:hypothetical protein
MNGIVMTNKRFHNQRRLISEDQAVILEIVVTEN